MLVKLGARNGRDTWINQDRVDLIEGNSENTYIYAGGCSSAIIVKMPVEEVVKRLKDFRNEVMNMNSIAIIQRLDKLIEEVER